MKPKTYRFRRLAAVIIDWNLSCLPVVILSALLGPLFEKGLHLLIFIPIWLTFPVLFLHRDRLFNGRSPGNRLMELTVLDRQTLQPLAGKALVTRNLFILLGGLDILVLLITGSTLGDRKASALVVPTNAIPAKPIPREPATKQSVLKTFLIAAVCLALFIGVIFLALESVKDEPHYAAAYSYLVESDAFAQLDAEPGDALLTGFSLSSTTRNGVTETKAVFTFLVKGRQLEITCHPQGETWCVCKDCTPFQ